jgi:hypothetical protein
MRGSAQHGPPLGAVGSDMRPNRPSSRPKSQVPSPTPALAPRDLRPRATLGWIPERRWRVTGNRLQGFEFEILRGAAAGELRYRGARRARAYA